MRILFFSTLILIISILFSAAFYKVANSNKQPKTFIEIKEKGYLKVAIDERQPGYFKFNSTEYGYNYSMLAEFCKFMNIELQVIDAVSANKSISMLNNGEIDIACVINTADVSNHITTHVVEDDNPTKSNYVLLSNKNSGKVETFDELKELVKDKKVVMPHNFTTTKSYNLWLDSVSNVATISYKTSPLLIEKLKDGEIDYLICTYTDAVLKSYISNNLEIIHSFKEDIKSVLLVKSENIELENQFKNWFNEFKETEEYKVISRLYKNDKFISKFILDGYITRPYEISSYDNLIREKSDKFDYDWRFISAIAYNESRFRPYVSSHRGAKGLMQIMPAIARQFSVSDEEIVIPSNNIEVALKLLHRIENMLALPENISDKDRLSIVLACYNGGIGHVSDARRLAKKYGANPNKWDDVKNYLKAKSDKDFYTDKLVKNGRFLGGETFAFVDNVWSKYDEYCKFAI